MTVGHRSLRGSARRGFAVAAMSALVLATLPLSGTAFGAQENTEYLTGADNVEAALEWSQFTFDSAAAVAVGRDDVFADSLASGLIQGLGEGVPLLLTDSDTLDPAVTAEIERLGATTVHILGGETAIGSGVEDALEAEGLTIHRHAGASRVETAIDIASKHGAAATTAIVARAFASGADPTQAFADSLAAGGWAAEDDLPILLTQTNELHDAVEAYLASSDIDAVNVVGGTSAVSDAVVSSIEALGIDVTRVSGPTRFDTAIEIAKARGFASAADATDGVVVIEGQSANAWAAGFAAAAYAAGAGPATPTQAIGVDGRPIVLVNGNEVPAATQAFLAQGGGIHVVCFSNATACDAASAAAGNGVLADGNMTALDVPELVSAEVGRTSSDTTVVRYVFDDVLDEDAIDESDFSIVLYDGTLISANDDAQRSNSNERAVDVEFDEQDVLLATVVVVEDGAVENESGDESIEGSAPLQEVSLEAGITDGPDLLSVELNGDDSEAEFVFDEDLESTATASSFTLLLDSDGDGQLDATPDESIVGTAADVDDNVVTVTFGSQTVFDDDDEEEDVVRAIVTGGAVQADFDSENNLTRSVELEEEFDSPVLESVSIDVEESEVTFEFSESLNEGTPLPVASNFDLFDARGNIVNTGEQFEEVNGNEVVISYSDDIFEDNDVVLAVVADGAVRDEDGDPLDGPQSVGVDAGSFEAGQTVGPDLEASSLAEDLDTFGEVAGLELTLDFDEDLDDDAGDIAESNFIGYEADGDANTSLIEDGDCDISDDDDSVLICTIDEDEAEDILVVVMEADAVQDEEGVGNYLAAVVLES